MKTRAQVELERAFERRGLLPREIVVDLFAGGGGASTGIGMALSRSPDIAINHSAAAIAMHTANHPAALHYQEDIWDVDPRKAVGRRKVGLLWASPDCTHFSRAKSGVPKSKKIRALAQVVIRWAALVRPRIIIVENVPEFVTWGPLDDDGHPIKALAGVSFDAWVADLRLQGYAVEWRTLVAADFGSPTSRKRLFVIARCDGQPIVWPTPTHGPGRPLPWRTAAEIIDWSIPCPSIFGRKKPLADKTLARIARGLDRFVLNNADPFIIKYYGTGGANSVDDPLGTVTSRDRFALVAPTLVQTGQGEREGQAPRILDLHKPLTTVVAGGQKHGLVAAFLTKHNGGHEATGQRLQRPMPTVTAGGNQALTVAWCSKFYGTTTGSDFRQPLPTVTGSGNHLADVRALLLQHGIGAANDNALVTVRGETYYIADIGMRMLDAHELFAAQGFPADYDLLADRLTKTQRIALAGNSVCPQLSDALVRAQLGLVPEPRIAA